MTKSEIVRIMIRDGDQLFLLDENGRSTHTIEIAEENGGLEAVAFPKG